MEPIITGRRLTTLCGVDLLPGVVVTPAATVTADPQGRRVRALQGHGARRYRTCGPGHRPGGDGVRLGASGRFGWHCTISSVPMPADAKLRSLGTITEPRRLTRRVEGPAADRTYRVSGGFERPPLVHLGTTWDRPFCVPPGE
jgi:hypothetical protein